MQDNPFTYFLADSYDYQNFWEKNLEKCSFFNKQKIILKTELLKVGRFSRKLVKRKYIITQDSIYYLKVSFWSSNIERRFHIKSIWI